MVIALSRVANNMLTVMVVLGFGYIIYYGIKNKGYDRPFQSIKNMFGGGFTGYRGFKK
jgi:hypothetical protein